MEKIKIITHDDLDGVGCAIVTKILNPYAEVEIVFARNDNVDAVVERHITMADNCSMFLITDLSVSLETAELLDELSRNTNTLVSLLDHHKTALHLADKYTWANVIVTGINHFGIECKTCGTQLVYNRFGGFNDMSQRGIKLNTIVEMIRSYDTWDWSINNYVKVKQFNDLFKILGKDRFMSKIMKFIHSVDTNFLIDSTDEFLLQLEQEKINKYIMEKEKQAKMTSVTLNDKIYTTAIIFADKYVSELGNVLCKRIPLADFITIVMPDSISFRSVKDDVDVAELAKKYGGGGHKAASGMSFDNTKFIEILHNELNK